MVSIPHRQLQPGIQVLTDLPGHMKEAHPIFIHALPRHTEEARPYLFMQLPPADRRSAKASSHLAKAVGPPARLGDTANPWWKG